MTPCLLADDLSGALEAGAAFRARGWRVVLTLAGSPPPAAAGELRVITTESRNLAPDAAAAAVRRALGARPAAAPLWFKKIDSTLRGPIGAELKALIAELTPPLVILCPANPAAGRTVRGGIVRVHGVPLAETDFRHDPVSPAKESSLLALLAAQGVTQTTSITLEDLRGEGLEAMLTKAAGDHGVLICDAETEGDLTTLVRVVRTSVPAALLVGSGALATALARELSSPVGAPAVPPLPAIDSLLILCGSRHPASQQQLDLLAEKEPGSVVSVTPGVDDATETGERVAASLRSRRVAAIRFDGKEPASAESAARLLTCIGTFARDLLARVAPAAIFLTGGETAWTVCNILRGNSLEILAELEPGVVLARLGCEARQDVLIITKPGGFGADTLMSSLVPKNLR